MKIIIADSKVLSNQNRATGDFVSLEVFGEVGKIDRYCSISCVIDDKLVAGCLLHNWHPEAGVIEMTSAATDRRWLSRPMIRAMFSTAFDALQCQLVALRVSDRNDGMLAIARRFGFEMVHIPRLRGVGEGEYICTLTAETWRASRYS